MLQTNTRTFGVLQRGSMIITDWLPFIGRDPQTLGCLPVTTEASYTDASYTGVPSVKLENFEKFGCCFP